ncbi:trehalose-6-phosphate synthase [Geothrix sp. SG200]|uniref:alpha,alpha-trehalose-phosphate synthase (UDP-forming) n=1 Tax=Geothrix sp. SG200 TaxID=2922865 RepID=UPI001FAC7B57|nr:trehalose-6-phosphate synthase [Geothrix sp. SG200]
MTIDLIASEREPSQLIVASHRGPFAQQPEGGWRRRVNGVFGAMEPVMRATGGTWVCWGLREEGEVMPERHRTVLIEEEERFRIHEVLLTGEEAKEFYEGFTTESLWPILFCFPSRLQFTPGLWDTYRMVNERFAHAIARLAAPRATVWVQDFHLMLLPGLLRKLRPDLKLGFFLHTAFPPPDVFGILPWREELLDGVLGCDLVGFHIPLYATNFARSCGRFLGAKPHWRRSNLESHALAPTLVCDSLMHGGRAVKLLSLGIGAAREDLERLVDSPEAKAYASDLRSQMAVDHLLLSAERLDYVKGPVERVKAMEALFDRHPEWIGRVTLLQIAVPSREGVPEFERLRDQTHQAVGEVNSRLGTPTWLPIINLGRTLPLKELVGLYLAADVCLVTPLRDGMNLVAKEYALCREDGAVVLSEFAGAAFDLPGAVLVNPFSPEHVAEGIHTALTLPASERKKRFRAMRRVSRNRDLGWWRKAFTKELEEA